MRNLRNGDSIEDSIYGTHFTEEDVQTYMKHRRQKKNYNVEIVKKDQFIGRSDAKQSAIVRKRVQAGATGAYAAFGTKYTVHQVNLYVLIMLSFRTRIVIDELLTHYNIVSLC